MAPPGLGFSSAAVRWRGPGMWRGGGGREELCGAEKDLQGHGHALSLKRRRGLSFELRGRSSGSLLTTPRDPLLQLSVRQRAAGCRGSGEGPSLGCLRGARARGGLPGPGARRLPPMPSVQPEVIGHAIPLPPLQRDEVRAAGQDRTQVGQGVGVKFPPSRQGAEPRRLSPILGRRSQLTQKQTLRLLWEDTGHRGQRPEARGRAG